MCSRWRQRIVKQAPSHCRSFVCAASAGMGCCCCREKKKSDKQDGDSDMAPGQSNKEKSQSSKPLAIADEKKPNYFVALWDYEAASKAEVTIKAGDRLRQLEEVDCSAGPEWVFATILGEERFGTGYVPRAFIAMEGSLETERWYFGTIPRRTADTILCTAAEGTFLIRRNAEDSDAQKRSTVTTTPYALSVKTSKRVEHYPIHRLSPRFGHGYFLTKRKKFRSLIDLVEWYRRNKEESSTRLDEPPRKQTPDRVELSVEGQKNWREIPRDRIRIGNEIGRGHFAVVYEGVWSSEKGTGSQRVAIKVLKRGSTSARGQFLQEAAIMKNLCHPRLVKLYGVICSMEPFWLITEFVKDGSLRDYLRLRQQSGQLLLEFLLIDICAQVAEGMRYMEEKRVVHRDLAARNVLVDVKGGTAATPLLEAKIADFGLAKMLSQSTALKAQKKYRDVPVKWTAPEALKDAIYSSASDVWSFGILVHEVFTHGHEPYPIMNGEWVRDYVVHKRMFLTKNDRVPQRVYEMMTKCFRYNPFERPSFAEIYLFFDQYDRSRSKGKNENGSQSPSRARLPVYNASPSQKRSEQ